GGSCDVLWGKYKRDGSDSNVIAKASDLHLWKSIVKLWLKLEALRVWTIGDGRSVN
ncbi:hypothetical protein A2U01_0047861, partial [Trifolium medium]|nr:hypothetical protein [Trifolium medium]